jgi:5-methylcytosine-specific restriction endonuclease McrA
VTGLTNIKLVQPLKKLRNGGLTVGDKINRLTVTGWTYRDNRLLAVCRCQCGGIVIRPRAKITSGESKSCGCLREQTVRRYDNGDAVRYKIFKQYQRAAAKRELVFELKETEVHQLLESPCSYCGVTPTRRATETTRAKLKLKEDSLLVNGIDRIDNSLGYTKSNSVACCWQCNRAKGARPLGEFLTWAKTPAVNHFELEELHAASYSQQKCVHNFWKELEHNSPKRGLDFSLTHEQVYHLITSPCAYCGTLPSRTERCNKHNMLANGIDRVDNSKGYTPSNVVPCCFACNNAKFKSSTNDFITWKARLRENLYSKGGEKL